MAHRARVVALLTLLFHVTALRSDADQPALQTLAPAELAAAPADGWFSVARDQDPVSSSEPPAAAPDADLSNLAAAAPDADPSDFAAGSLPDSWVLPPQPVDEVVWCPNYYVAFEAVSLAREIGEDRVFATLNTPTNDVLNTNDLGFHYEAGMRVILGAKLTDYYAVEITAMGLSDWKEAAAVTDATLNPGGTAGNLFSPFTGFGSTPEEGLDFNEVALIRLSSSLDTLEWNLHQRLAALESESFAATAIYGFRYLRVDELLEYRTHSTIPLPAGSANELDIAVDNHLYGLQLGAAVDYVIGPCWINVEGKAAVCRNAIFEEANGSMVSRADPLNVPLDRIREEGATAFVGQLSATVEYQFAENWVGRIGYQAIVVDGLALASRSTPAELGHDASAVYHGPIAGLIVAW